MIIFFNTYKIPTLLFTIMIMFSSCNSDELDIENDFPFEVSVMPVPNEIANGETVEIRMKILRSGNYQDTTYFIRYFQFDGEGTLQYEEELPYQPNDLYELESEEFRLYYTSLSEESTEFSVWIFDNLGNEKQLDFQFRTEN